jgi:hypothetical protein
MAKRASKARSARKSRRQPGHVFVSYAHADRARVEPLVHSLQARNLDVWWDQRIEPGQTWSLEIERKLRSASCVVVAWTQDSVNSLFVRAEARDALDSATELELVLGVVLDEGLRLPLPFGEGQLTFLTDWDGRPNRALIRLASVARKLTMRGPPPDFVETLASKGALDDQRRAAAELRDRTTRIRALADLLASESQPAAKLRNILIQVHKTYDAVNQAIETFESAATEDNTATRREFAKRARGRLRKLIRDGRGHCSRIDRAYHGNRGLRAWLEEHATERKVQQADRAFDMLTTADINLFDRLEQIGTLLTNEARAIGNLFVTGSPAAARRRILRGHGQLAALERELDKGIGVLQKVEQRVGYVHER